MWSFSVWHWLVVLLVGLVWTAPFAITFKRAGRSPWWGLLAFIPPFGLWAIWVLALTKWGIADAREEPVAGYRT